MYKKMKWFSKAAVGGLLWLSFSAASAGTLLNITGHTENVENGGQFSAFLGMTDTQNLNVYCVDDLNFIGVPSTTTVNVTDLANSTEVYNFTRYGQTAATAAQITPAFPDAFSTNTVVIPAAIGTAQDRYAMAAWLITQFKFSSGVTTADDQIQNAIWTLLDATGATYTNNGGIGTFIAQAEAWINAQSPAALTAFENTVVIYSDVKLASESDPARYSGTAQEMIGFTTTPEPATFAMLGIGLMTVGLVRKRIKGQ
jgi:PEP-CTERM motif-containing protein